MSVLHLVNILQHVRQVLEVGRVASQLQHSLSCFLFVALAISVVLVLRVFEVEVRLKVLGIVNRVIFAGDDIVKPLALLVTFECGFVELVMDCLVLLVINELL